MSRLRVLTVVNALYFGGDENRVLALAKAIDRDRFDHIVLTLKRVDAERESVFGSLRPHFTAAGIDVVDLGEAPPPVDSAHGTVMRVARSMPRLAGTLRKLTQFVVSHSVDVIDAHIGTGNQLGIAAGLLTRRPAVVTTYRLEHFRPLWLWRASETAVLNAASSIVTDSDYVAAEIRGRLLFPKRIAVIPNGIPLPASSKTRDEMRAALNIPPGTRVIGQVSSLSPRKGHLVLLEAARRLLQLEPTVHFLICGFARAPFDYARKLQRRAAELGLQEHVTFVGYPGPIGDVYQAIDIQVHASTEESLPQAIIEGMSLAKPAVVTAIAGIPSMVVDGESGLVVPPNEPEAIATALLRLLRDPALAHRFGAAARARYLARYTDSLMARSLESVFEDVARSRHAAVAHA